MIVNSDALVLVEGDPTLDPNLPLIGWHNLVTISNITADTAEANYPATNLANPSTFERWQGVELSPSEAQYLTFDPLDYIDDIDYLAIARHNFGTAAIAVSVDVYSEVGDSPEEPLWQEVIAPLIPANDAPLLFRLPPQSIIGARLKMEPGTAPPTDAVAYVGKLLVCERGMQVGFTPLPYGRVTKVTNNRSESGNFLGRIVTGSYTRSAPLFSFLTPAWYRANMDPFIEASVESPFFFAWSPDEYPDEVGFAWLTGDPQPSIHHPTGRMQVKLPMRGIVK